MIGKKLLISGEVIIIHEKLPSWDSTEEFYKVERENGSFFIIADNDLNKLIKQDNHSKKLSTTEKLELFYNYFQGRPDIYATKWESKAGKVGFSPHGEGTWINKNGKYRKEIHTYYPYTLQTINDHIRAEKHDFKMGVGIYPMLENDMTKLIVIDFDKEDALKEAGAVVKICQKYNIDVLIERSQSGEGIHLWFFFEEEIPASRGRIFGQLIIRLAMIELDVLKFESFDRIIPMQDTLPSNGFGNVIALPLRADKVKENKTVFLDEKFRVVSDFWKQLMDTTRYSSQEIEQFISLLSQKMPIQFYKQDQTEIKTELPEKILIQSSGELKISKDQLTRKSIIQLAHLATFHNPEFYKLQNMRAPTWNVNQYMTVASEDDEYLYLPRGLKSELEKLDTNSEFIEQLNDGHKINVEFEGKLREQQNEVVKAMLNNDVGIVSAPTGFGKTVVAANLIAQRKTSTLILVHSKVLAAQWKKRLEEFLAIQSAPFKEYTPTGRVRKKDKIGELYSGKESLSHNIDIALFQTLANRENLTEFLEPYGMVIVDEVHHTAAQTFDKIIKNINARYLYGLTATIDRKDGLTPIIFMRFGEILADVEVEEENNLLIPKYFYPRFTNYSDLNPELNYTQHLNNMVNIEERNEQIVIDIVENIDEKRTCLVLTERIAHAEVLKQLLEERLKEIKVYILTSEETEKSNQADIGEMQNTNSEFVVIATSLKVGEGFDLLKLESIFFTLPFSWKARTTQYVGRLHRGLEEKDELRVYDYVDIGVEMFGKMYQKRMKVYNKLNYQLAEDGKTREMQTQLYTVNTYQDVLKLDLSNAKKIVFSVVSTRQLNISEIAILYQSGKEIEILIKGDKLKQQQQFVKELENLNVKITRLKVNPFSFIICDEKIIWYGNINFGINNNADATTLRLSNRGIANKIMEQYVVR